MLLTVGNAAVRSQVQLDHDTRDGVAEAVDLVNTADPVRQIDELTSLAALTVYLDAHQMTGTRSGTDAELRDVRRLRQRVRAIFEAAAEGTHPRVVTEINRLAADTRAVPRLVEHGGKPLHLHFTPPDAPLHHRLGADIGVALAIVVRDGGMDRLRICASPDCGRVLVDVSRNSSRRYCSIQCANRQHVAAYRARRSTTAD
jgi:predicted RNA-binding Zn ribbon-like protein